MKRQWFSLTLLLFLGISSVGVIPQQALAEGQTKGDVQFFEDDQVEPPVDPKDPDKPILPKEPPTAGPYSLSYASSIQFGTQEISDETKEYYAQLDTITPEEGGESREVPNFIQLTDKSGKSQGWQLTVKQVAPVANEKGFALTNTQFVFRHMTAFGAMKEATPPSGLSTAEVVLSGDKLNEAALIAKAGQDSGQGTWTIQFGKDEEEAKQSIALRIPGETKKEPGTYKTTLMWELTNGL